MAKKKTHEEFVVEVCKLIGDDYTVIGIYINNYTKVKMKHNICGHEYKVKPTLFLRGTRCPLCNIKRQIKTHEAFLREVNELVGDEYLILNKYEGAKRPIKIKHNICEYEYETNPSNFLSGSRCLKCAGLIRKDTDLFKKEIYELVGNEYSVLGEYVNNRTYIKMRHNECELIYNVSPHNFLKGRRCPECSKIKAIKSRTRTTEQFKKEVYELEGNRYNVLGEYISYNEKIKLKHNVCGHIYDVTPAKFFDNRRCPECSKKQRSLSRIKTHNEFIEQVYKLLGDEYSILDQYKGNRNHIKIKHNTCNNVYDVRPYNLFSGKRCPECSKKIVADKQKKTHEEFVAEVYELVKNEYKILGEYVNTATKIKIKHNNCGHKWDVVPANFLSGNRCPKCNGTLRRTVEMFQQDVYKEVGNEYTVLGEFINTSVKVKMKHNKCGHKWDVVPSNFFYGTRCPKCNVIASKGEIAITEWLEKNNIKYKYNMPYGNCRYINLLRFDFRLYKKDGSVLMIEFQGKGHDTPIEHRGGQKALEKQQIKDQIKRDYCKEHNIPLLEIWYWDFDNIEQILEKELLPLNLMQSNNKEIKQNQFKQLEFNL